MKRSSLVALIVSAVLIVVIVLVMFVVNYLYYPDIEEYRYRRFNFETRVIEIRHIEYIGTYSGGLVGLSGPHPVVWFLIDEWYTPITDENCSVEKRQYDPEDDARYYILCEYLEDPTYKYPTYSVDNGRCSSEVSLEDLKNHGLPVPVEHDEELPLR